MLREMLRVCERRLLSGSARGERRCKSDVTPGVAMVTATSHLTTVGRAVSAKSDPAVEVGPAPQ